MGSGPEKENGIAPVSPTAKNYEILRRTAVEDLSAAEAVPDNEGANGTVIEDKAVKPKELVREMSTKKVDGNGITNGNSSPQINSSPDTSAKALEDDGWSTVSKTRNNRRNGNQDARAIAY